MSIPKLVSGRHGLFVAYPDDPFLGEAISEYGEYGEEEAKLLLSIIPQDGVIVEVGANCGYLTIPLARKAKVIAVEPQKYVFRVLVANAFLNGLEDRVSLINKACGASEGTVFMPITDFSVCEGHGTADCRFETDPVYSVSVPMVTVDSLVETPINLIKIDVEGFELEVLKGCVDTIKSYSPVLYVENDRIPKSQELIEYIWSLGYDCCWHTPLLFNPDNWLGNSVNVWNKEIASFNMLCGPKGLVPNPIVDSTWHPLRR